MMKPSKEELAREKLIVALDMSDIQQVRQLVKAVGNQVTWYKVGMELFYSEGAAMVEELLKLNKKIFLDLKFHDIPNTVAGAARAATRMGAAMFNVHTAGGLQMMKEAKAASVDEAEKRHKKPPIVLGVTVLTSMDEDTFHHDLGYEGTISDRVTQWAVMAREAGLDGVVASAREAEAIRAHCGNDFLIVTPGIRPAGTAADDQSRVMDPPTALKAGADYLVVGRPITKDPVPAAAAARMLASMIP